MDHPLPRPSGPCAPRRLQKAGLRLRGPLWPRSKGPSATKAAPPGRGHTQPHLQRGHMSLSLLRGAQGTPLRGADDPATRDGTDGP